MKRIGIIFNAANRDSGELALALRERLQTLSYDCRLADSREEAEILDSCAAAEVLVTVGGDGTILRTAKVAVVLGAPILGVNMGKLGFMTEMRGADALERVPDYLKPGMWVEERATLDVEVTREGEPLTDWALNEAVVSRGRRGAADHGAGLRRRRLPRRIPRRRRDSGYGHGQHRLRNGGGRPHPRAGKPAARAGPRSPRTCRWRRRSFWARRAASSLKSPAAAGPSSASTATTTTTSGPATSCGRARAPRTAKFLRARKPPYFFETLAQRLGLDRLPGAAAGGPP